jgi:sodium transport system permease protein
MSTHAHTPRPGRRAGAVFRKEFREILRDRRTIFAVVISPLLITPLMFALLGSVIGRQTQRQRVESYTVGVIGADHAPSVQQALAKMPNMRFVAVTREEAERRIQRHTLRAAVVFPEEVETRLQKGHTVSVDVLLDAGSDASRRASQRLQALFREGGQRIVAQRLTQRGLQPELARPFQIREQEIKSGGTSGTFMLAMFLPYVLSISAILGGIHAANDLVAGEKERGTLETLLASPASRRDLVLGKFFAIAAVSLVSSLLSVVGIIVPFYLPVQAFAWLARGGLSLGPAAVAAMLLVQLPLAVLGAGLLLAISTFARSQKEAQGYLGPVFLTVTVAAMMSMFLPAESSWPLALVPILNAALVLKQAISNTFDATFLLVAIAASVAYAGLAVTFATRLFEKESVLLKA